MFCGTCGNKINQDSKFCSSCGSDLSELVSIKDDRGKQEAKTTVKSEKNILLAIIEVIFFILAFLAGKYLGLLIFLFIGAAYLGLWFPGWYIKRKKINISFVKWIVWSNTLTWFLPPLGLITSLAAFKFGDYFPRENKRYKIIAILALVASILNALVGVLIKL